MDVSTVVTITIVAALLFGTFNGFHDAANSIATVVSTRVMSPRFAVLWAATFNFVALWIFGDGVARMIAGIVTIDPSEPGFVWVVLCGVIGALLWNLLTLAARLPSSSSHALIGSLAGAGIAYAGFDVLVKAKLKLVLYFVVVAPVLAFMLGSLVMLIVAWALRRWRPQKVDTTFRYGQLFSSAAYSIGHGGNDAQKTMGIILAVMIAAGRSTGDGGDLPAWIAFASYGSIALGTAIGGWRIKSMGLGLTHLKPVGGFAAEVAGAATLVIASTLHVPVSTTHTITGAVVGVGSTNKLRGIRWGVARRIVWAWVVTIPAAAVVGAAVLAIARLAGAWG